MSAFKTLSELKLSLQFVQIALSYTRRAAQIEVGFLVKSKNGFKPDLTHCLSLEKQVIVASPLPKTDLSMFLLLALLKATIPSLARASKENGSIPCKQSDHQQKDTAKNTFPHSGTSKFFLKAQRRSQAGTVHYIQKYQPKFS